MGDFARYADRFGKALTKDRVIGLQMNLGYACNLSCAHCHLQAGPHRTEVMSRQVIDDCISFARRGEVRTVDLTGGAPELNPHLRHLVRALRRLPSVQTIILRSNLTLLEEDPYADLPAFLAESRVDIVASLPCYLEGNVEIQRGDGVYAKSVRALKMLNRIGYGTGGSRLDLVYNPGGGFLPASQPVLEAAYKKELAERFGIAFDSLYTIANIPIGRFRDALAREGRLEEYLTLLEDAFNGGNLEKVMCRHQVNVDWQGRIYDCDFNQVLGLPLSSGYIKDALPEALAGRSVKVGEHCFACTAGAGSSCRGSLSA